MLSAPRPARGGDVSFRCIALVSRQESQALAIELADSGILLVEAESSERDDVAVERTLKTLGFDPVPLDTGEITYYRAASPALLADVPRVAAEDPAYSRKPAYYDAERVQRWVDRLAQPWEPGRDRDTET